MTKVFIHPDLLAYQQGMKEILRQVVQYNFIDGIAQPERVDPEACLLREDVLPPPDIELIFVDTCQEDEGEQDYITAQVYADFGAVSVHVAIRDDQGNPIESGEMCLFPNQPSLWDYLPGVRVPRGRDVVVEVTAMDCMGGIGTRWVEHTMGDDKWSSP
jgi:hypothetical protein